MKEKKVKVKIEINKQNLKDFAEPTFEQDKMEKLPLTLSAVLWSIKDKVENLRYNTKGMNKEAQSLTYDLYDLVKCYTARFQD